MSVLGRGTFPPPCRGPALGFFSDVNYGSTAFSFKSGDRLLLYSDGLTEVNDPKGKELGEDGLIQLVNGKCDLSMSGLCDELMQDILRFSATQSFRDDVCLLSIESTTAQDDQP